MENSASKQTIYYVYGFTYFTVRLGLWALQRSHPPTDGHLLQEGVALGLRIVRSLQLTKVELHSTVVADDVWEKSLAIQTVLVDLESDLRVAAILGERHHHLGSLKVLK